MKKVLVINGHPADESLCRELAKRYIRGAQSQQADVEFLNLAGMQFDPLLRQGYRQIQVLEPDLKKAQTVIQAAHHIVVVYPIWWSSVPALLKGFFDRTLLPGFAFKYKKEGLGVDRLLKGKTAEILLTTDAPWWWNKFVLGDPAIRMVKKGVLEFCGVDVRRITSFDSVRSRTDHEIQNFLEKAYQLGTRMGR